VRFVGRIAGRSEGVPDADSTLDLDAYFARVGHAGGLSPTLPVLEALHLAHATHIPFENLDVLLGRPIRLDLESLQAKLVRGRRGGYCFEQNLLFAAVLERVGFGVTRLAARVRLGATRLLPRTHMLLAVDVGGEPWLADVGFGGDGLLGPLPLAPDRPVRQYDRTYRLVGEPGGTALQMSRGEGWLDLYAFTTEPQHLVDYELANYFVSTHPESIFVRTLTAQRPTPEVRYALRNRTLTMERNGTTTARTVEDDELLRVLSETFGLDFPPGTRFPIRP
jgi:N-hydroxyarylamine O-acetyltransferase